MLVPSMGSVFTVGFYPLDPATRKPSNKPLLTQKVAAADPAQAKRMAEAWFAWLDSGTEATTRLRNYGYKVHATRLTGKATQRVLVAIGS